MHRTEGADNQDNLFVDGPPGTIVGEDWLNTVQEELVAIILAAGIALKTADTDTRDQLLAALNALYEGIANKDVANGYMGLDANKSPNNWPSFSVHKNGANQAGVGTALEIITWATEEFDTNSDFASNRFTPTVAGKYLLTASLHFASSNVDILTISIYKNGSEYKTVQSEAAGGQTTGIGITAVVDANGSGDYFEIFGANATSADTVCVTSILTYFM